MMCVRCAESYGSAVARWERRGAATVTATKLTEEAVCAGCHGRLEAGETAELVQWHVVGERGSRKRLRVAAV